MELSQKEVVYLDPEQGLRVWSHEEGGRTVPYWRRSRGLMGGQVTDLGERGPLSQEGSRGWRGTQYTRCDPLERGQKEAQGLNPT